MLTLKNITKLDDADPRAIHQIDFTANLDRGGNTISFSFLIYFILEEAKETVLYFSQGTVKFL